MRDPGDEVWCESPHLLIVKRGTTLSFHVRPLSTRCRQPLASRANVCFGISPFNSYFSTERIARLAEWGLREFASIHFFVPDVPAAYTLEALGYSSDRATHKARRQGQYLRNKILRALASLGLDHPDRILLGWAELEGNQRYRQLLAEAGTLFESDPDFRAGCLDASRWVLDKRLPPGSSPTSDQLHSAARYFLAELPLFADTAGIVGAASSVFCYHQCIPFLHRFYGGELAWRPAVGQGFAVVNAAPETVPA